ncbi:hypothetical protein CCHR01_15505 [Colletotrichum chrysophilum]|uniref:Uncharacterized protein n=1 Tax=Colletotrichum chrysophilum TaxID=1836956 RepID=A0AAD9EBC2_9PEZI|nr:hypothetical protein CCHR01_15505 [Colletotrichum chrysophilum]
MLYYGEREPLDGGLRRTGVQSLR